jgi:hypothetical protein
VTLISGSAAALAAAILLQGAAAPSPAAALKESLAQNQAKLRTYTWVETTQVSLKGEVKKQDQKQCFYGADGKVQKTPIPGAAAPAAAQQSQGGGRRGGGKMKQKIVENKVDEMKDYMEKVAALVQQYVPPAADKIGAAQAAGNVSSAPSGGALTVKVKDYAKPGDLLAIGLDPASMLLTSYHVDSYVEKPKDDAVALAVTFGRLDDGTSYPQKIVLDATAKKIQVTITNSGYKKSGT